MTRRSDERDERGFWGIGMYRGKKPVNLGTLWRSAHAFGASFLFTVACRYKHQPSDTVKAWRHIPLYEYTDIGDLVTHLPHDCRLFGVELTDNTTPLPIFQHPQRACYLLGAEDNGLPEDVIAKCHKIISIPGASRCLNVAVAGSIVMYDRLAKNN